MQQQYQITSLDDRPTEVSVTTKSGTHDERTEDGTIAPLVLIPPMPNAENKWAKTTHGFSELSQFTNTDVAVTVQCSIPFLLRFCWGPEPEPSHPEYSRPEWMGSFPLLKSSDSYVWNVQSSMFAPDVHIARFRLVGKLREKRMPDPQDPRLSGIVLFCNTSKSADFFVTQCRQTKPLWEHSASPDFLTNLYIGSVAESVPFLQDVVPLKKPGTKSKHSSKTTSKAASSTSAKAVRKGANSERVRAGGKLAGGKLPSAVKVAAAGKKVVATGKKDSSAGKQVASAGKKVRKSDAETIVVKKKAKEDADAEPRSVTTERKARRRISFPSREETSQNIPDIVPPWMNFN